jgi:7-keto-8-aminopelargonate synthetase-like enzyme
VRRHDFTWINHIPSSHSVTLLIDDSHGFGMIGRDGAGIFTEINCPPHVRLVVITSFGKAFGIPGGVVLGDQPFIDQLRKSLFFSASSPVIPAYLFAFLQSADIYRQARTRLFDNSAHFSEQISNLGLFQTFPDYPVFYTPDNHLHDYLQERQVLISCFPYPSPHDSCITRVVLSSLHTPEDINQLATLILKYAHEQP